MTGLIPQHFIDDLIARVNIVDIIDAHVPLKQAGRDYRALCPFHDEKTPSFSVSQEKQFYHCFGCGAHGTAIGFLMDYLHLEFRDAVEELANKANLEIPVEARRGGQSAARYTQLYELMDRVISIYHNNLGDQKQTDKAAAYLTKRGISKEIITEYQLGYARPGWEHITKALGGSAADLQALSTIGVIAKNNRGGFYDYFRDRIIFPIRDPRGRAIGLGGRVLGDGTPKYLNTPATPIFHKGRELYGLYQARKAIKDADSVYIVEGYMDVIALAQCGLPNVVATLGTATTKEHVETAFRVSGTLIFCFDGDVAGKKAAHKAMQLALPLLHEGRQIFFRFIPQGDDPDDYIRRRGPEQFGGREQLTPLSEYLLSFIQRDLSPAVREDKDKMMQRAAGCLRDMPQSGLKQMLTNKISSLTDLEAGQIESHYQRNNKAAAPPGSTSTGPANISPMRIAISSLLRKPDLLATLDIEPELEQIEIAGHKLLREIVQFISAHPNTSAAGIIEHWRQTKYGALLEKLTPMNSPYGGEDETLYADEQIRQTFIAAINSMQAMTRKHRLRKLADINSVSELTDEHRRLLPRLADKK